MTLLMRKIDSNESRMRSLASNESFHSLGSNEKCKHLSYLILNLKGGLNEVKLPQAR